MKRRQSRWQNTMWNKEKTNPARPVHDVVPRSFAGPARGGVGMKKCRYRSKDHQDDAKEIDISVLKKRSNVVAAVALHLFASFAQEASA